jgi:hypothetical protein
MIRRLATGGAEADGLSRPVAPAADRTIKAS